jgi:hypothetical protein
MVSREAGLSHRPPGPRLPPHPLTRPARRAAQLALRRALLLSVFDDDGSGARP